MKSKWLFCSVLPQLPQTVTQSMYITADCCLQRDRVSVMFSVLLYSTFTVPIVYTLYLRTFLPQLPQTVTQSMYITADCCLHRERIPVMFRVLLYSIFTVKYCTNCTVYSSTVLTVITHKLLLHVQVQNRTTHLLYKHCTNCTVYSWTVLTVNTHKLLLHIQLHNRNSSSWCLLM
jgi:hypothetical protein